MGLLNWFKREGLRLVGETGKECVTVKPLPSAVGDIHVHVHIDAAEMDAAKLAEKIRTELLRAERRGGITKPGTTFLV